MANCDCVVAAGADLGEGANWDPAAQVLLWVDITRGLIHGFDPANGATWEIDVGQPVGAAVPRRAGGMAAALRDGFALVDGDGAVDLIAPLETDDPTTRMNDGGCDKTGRFWATTMDFDAERPVGSLYRLDPDGVVERVLTGITVPNGPAWSPDYETMYFTDTALRRIDAFDYDVRGGVLSNRRTFLEPPEVWGFPDGMTVDAEGFLWVAFWDGAAVRRFSAAGELAEMLELPASRITSCAFGGPRLEDLYITSARYALPQSALLEQPQAGGLFRSRPGVTGVPSYAFAG